MRRGSSSGNIDVVVVSLEKTLFAEVAIGSPYGPSTIAGPDDKRAVADVELLTARSLGVRLARVASALKIVRITTTQRQVDVPAYVTRGE